MPSSLFTATPDWGWPVVLYFFFGGIAGGSYAIAALIDLFGAEVDQPLARLGYFVSFGALLPCPPLLIVDLTRPERFWHLLVQSKTLLPMFKWWSPLSVGSWALLLFGGFALLSLLGALYDAGRLRWGALRILRHGLLRRLVPLAGAVFGFFVASYTGVLLAVTNRPIWSDTNLLGLLFLVSGASSATALLLLLGQRRGFAASASLHRLARFDNWLMGLELLALVLVVISLGPLAAAWLSLWGVALLVGVVLVGILIPLALHVRPRTLGGSTATAGALLALIGGFVLRAVVVLSSESL
jgi:protein NrfD